MAGYFLIDTAYSIVLLSIALPLLLSSTYLMIKTDKGTKNIEEYTAIIIGIKSTCGKTIDYNSATEINCMNTKYQINKNLLVKSTNNGYELIAEFSNFPYFKIENKKIYIVIGNEEVKYRII